MTGRFVWNSTGSASLDLESFRNAWQTRAVSWMYLRKVLCDYCVLFF
jgi:hypothetical protein